MKSFMASPATIERKWYVVDATGYTLGRESNRQEAGSEDLLSPFRVCGRYERDHSA